VESDDRRVAAEQALAAAERAPGVAALWLAAGLLGDDAGAPWAERALRRACDLDPLGALAPFRLATRAEGDATSAVSGARALLAEPWLAAATEWRHRDSLYAATVDRIERWPGVDPRWRRDLVAALRSLPPVRAARTRPLHLELDGDAQSSLSLFVFRRLPWRLELGAVDLDVERLRRLQVGSAARRTDTEPWAFPKNGCGEAETPSLRE
jgi:hypothetical protein